MLVTPTIRRRDRNFALVAATVTVVAALTLGFFYPWFYAGVFLGPVAYWWSRRQCTRRTRVMAIPFPDVWEGILRSKVSYFNALDAEQQERFRLLTKVFLDETRITGIRTDVDETTRVLVAASAIIPVFAFDDWEYSGLGEVLIYPSSFNDDYSTDEAVPRDTLGMVGTGHLSGVMILSKPSLHTGFDIATDMHNVGIHEFAHLIDGADGAIDGLPPGVPVEVARSWIEWVGKELGEPADHRSHVRPYAYTNEAEYFAVLVEYFFEAPEKLKQKNPDLYKMLSTMFRQDTATIFPNFVNHRAKRFGRNSPCPCDSGMKFKKCCMRNATRGLPK